MDVYYVLKNNPLYKVLPIVTMGIPLTGLLAAILLLGEKPNRTLPWRLYNFNRGNFNSLYKTKKK